MPRRIKILLLSCLLLCALTQVARAADRPVLLELQKQEGLSSTRFSLLFDRTPEFTTKHSGQRIDILLAGTSLSDGLRFLPEDETVVKILLAEKGQDLLVSLLLRRPPQQVVSKSQTSPARIDFELYWDSARGSRPAVAFRIEGIPGRKGGRKVREEQEFPAWSTSWRDLFRSDLSPWTIDPPLNYSFPPLPPWAIENPSPALRQRLELVAEKHWRSLLRFQPQMPPLTGEEQLVEELLMIESLLRTGAIDAAEVRLRAFEDLQGPYRPRVDYLTDFAQALKGQAYAAYLRLVSRIEKLADADPYLPLATLLTLETALASGNDAEIEKLLEKRTPAWPQALKPVVTMRRADAQSGLGQFDKALELYRSLAESEVLLSQYPKSRARAAQAAYALGDYPRAAGLYRELAKQLADQPLEGLALNAAAQASYHAGEMEWALIGLQKIYLEMPGGEAADRAELRLQDHQVLSGDERAQAKAAYRYADLAKRSRVRLLREEASFKQALVLYLLGDLSGSVNLLMEFRRGFANGDLRPMADSLLREQLPTVIGQQVARGEDLAAVVLVEQNRTLLLKGKLDKDFLDQIAGALTRLGLYKRAARILLFQLDQAETPAQREEFYLPLVQLYLLRQEFRAASDYGRTYLDTYPRGERRGEVYGLMLDALEKQKRYDELLQQLERKDRPQSARLELRAAWFYWQQDRLVEAVARMENARKLGGVFHPEDMLLLAEAFYQLKRNAESAVLYKSLQAHEKFGAQAGYRSAQLELRRGNASSALKLLASVVEKDKAGPWSLLAQDLLKELGRN